MVLKKRYYFLKTLNEIIIKQPGKWKLLIYFLNLVNNYNHMSVIKFDFSYYIELKHSVFVSVSVSVSLSFSLCPLFSPLLPPLKTHS